MFWESVVSDSMGTKPNSAVGRRAPQGELCRTVVSAVASLKGVDPRSLEPLYTVVDPETLTALSENGSVIDGQVTFEWSNCKITVHSDRRIVVAPERVGPPVHE